MKKILIYSGLFIFSVPMCAMERYTKRAKTFDKKLLVRESSEVKKLIEKSLIDAAEEGDIEKVKEILAQNSEIDINAQEDGWDGFTALHYASEGGYIELVKLLLKTGAEVDCVSDLNSTTSLELALYKGRDEVAMLLIESGADDLPGMVNIPYSQHEVPHIGFLAACGCPKAMKHFIARGINLRVRVEKLDDLEVSCADILDIAKVHGNDQTCDIIQKAFVCDKLADISAEAHKRIFTALCAFNRLKKEYKAFELKDVQWKILLDDKDLLDDVLTGAAHVKEEKRRDYDYLMDTIIKRCTSRMSMKTILSHFLIRSQ